MNLELSGEMRVATKQSIIDVEESDQSRRKWLVS